jgi:hypothetical protein
MKIVTQNRIAVLRQRGFASLAASPGVGSCRLAVRSLAICAIVTLCLNPARAADALPVSAPGNQAALAQKPPYSPQGYEMKRYQAFARQAEMPVITATDKTTFEVGGTLKTDIRQLAQLSLSEKETLAAQFKVPAGVIDKLVQRVSTRSQPTADQFARDLRTAVVDYRFLQQEWGRYNPPPESRKLKAEALEALRTGDLTKAWELYDGLRKPQAPAIAPPPPTNLRVVAQ